MHLLATWQLKNDLYIIWDLKSIFLFLSPENVNNVYVISTIKLSTSQKFTDNFQYLQIALHPLWKKSALWKNIPRSLCHHLISCYVYKWGSLYFAQADEFPQNNWEECDQLAVTKSGWGRCHLWPGRDTPLLVTGHWSAPGNYKDGSARPGLSCSLSVNLWRVQWWHGVY